MPKLPTPLPNKRKFDRKWFELDWIDDGGRATDFRRYISTVKKRGLNYRIVAKAYPGFGTYRGVYVRQSKPPVPEMLRNLRRA